MMTWIAALLLSMIILLCPVQRYAAPHGNGDGTPDNPMSLASALAVGGDVWLMPGTYAGDLTLNTPVSLRSVPGTRATIDGAITINAADVTLQDLEITYTGWPSRVSAYAGSNPPDVNQKWLNIFGKRARILNNVIHDMAGVGWWKTATDSEMRGNLIYNNGWRGPDRGHGPGIYSQNNPDGAKWATDNVIGPSYSMTGFEFYGSSLAPLYHYHIERNVMIGTRFILGGGQSVVDAHVIGNLLWKSDLCVGYLNPLNGDAEIRNNYIGLGRLTPRTLTSLIMTGNTAINSGGVDVVNLVLPTVPYSYTINNNSYQSNRSSVLWNGPVLQDFAQWQAAGYDSGGSFGGLPTQPHVVVNGKIVTVFNWSNQPSVPAPIGGRYTNALNPAEQITLNAGDPLLMDGWTVAAPIAGERPLTTWDRQFAVFLVEGL